MRSLRRFAGARALTSETQLLDLGSADGSFVDYCIEQGLQAFGTDINDGVNLECDALPFDDGVFDVITANSVLEHLQSLLLFGNPLATIANHLLPSSRLPTRRQ